MHTNDRITSTAIVVANCFQGVSAYSCYEDSSSCSLPGIGVNEKGNGNGNGKVKGKGNTPLLIPASAFAICVKSLLTSAFKEDAAAVIRAPGEGYHLRIIEALYVDMLDTTFCKDVTSIVRDRVSSTDINSAGRSIGSSIVR